PPAGTPTEPRDTLTSAAPPADTMDSPAAPAAAAASPDSGTRLDLTHANAAQLDAHPGIGPVLAARIVAHRAAHGAFRSPDDLMAVPGIGPALFARLAPRVRVSPDSVQGRRAA